MRAQIVLAATATVAALVVLTGWNRPVVADAPQPVTVTNLPEIQRIEGRVVVTEPIPQTRFETKKALVTPADFSDTNHWTDAGSLETNGFTSVTLSLGGSLQGTSQAGTVGVILIPDVPEVTGSLRTYGVPQFGLRAEARVVPSPGAVFSSDSVTLRLGFPRYRVMLYNSTQKAADTVVYAYLGTS